MDTGEKQDTPREEQWPPRPWAIYSEEDMASPDFAYWTEERTKAWNQMVRERLDACDVRVRLDRLKCSRKLYTLLNREVKAALAAESWCGALGFCDVMYWHVDDLVYHCGPWTETRVADRDGLTLDAMRYRCVEKAEEVLRQAPASALDRLWKVTVNLCEDYFPCELFRDALLQYPWPEPYKSRIREAMYLVDEEKYQGTQGMEDGKHDPEPYRPVEFETKVWPGPKSGWEAHLAARKRAFNRNWLEWVRRNEGEKSYLVNLHDMAVLMPWGTLEDLHELFLLCGDKKWKSIMRDQLPYAPFWRDRMDEVRSAAAVWKMERIGS